MLFYKQKNLKLYKIIENLFYSRLPIFEEYFNSNQVEIFEKMGCI